MVSTKLGYKIRKITKKGKSKLIAKSTPNSSRKRSKIGRSLFCFPKWFLLVPFWILLSKVARWLVVVSLFQKSVCCLFYISIRVRFVPRLLGWPCLVPTSFRRWGECFLLPHHWVPLSCALYKSWEILYFQGLICLSPLLS